MNNSSENTFFQDFHTDRLPARELYGIVGGVVRNDEIDYITVDDLTHQDTAYDSLMPNWQEQRTGDKKLSNRNVIFSPLRFFRTLMK